jgi:dUTP pyrophosphatase
MCFDIFSIEDVILLPGVVNFVRTGLSFSVPSGYGMCFYDRSSLSAKNGIEIRSSKVLDSDYRGELFVPMVNMTNIEYHIKKGDRIAQGEVRPYLKTIFKEVEELDITNRGSGGFGSTGR